MSLNHSLVGMDIGKSGIKLSVVSKKGNKVYLDDARLIPRSSFSVCENEDVHQRDNSSAAEWMKGLQLLFKNGQFNKRPIVMNYVGKTPLIRYLTFPFMPENELEEAIKWETQKLITEPIETKMVDYAVLHQKEEGQKSQLEIILVVVDKNEISEGLEIFQKGGIYPRIMDVNPLALLKVIQLNHSKEKEQDILFIDIGSTKMAINICRKGVLRFTREIGYGGDEITRVLMDKKTISFEEAERIRKEEGLMNSEIEKPVKEEIEKMVLEVQRSIDYYRSQFRDISLSKILLMGGTPLMPGFQEHFGTFFDVPVILENPFSSMILRSEVLKELNPIGPLWAGSVGLALRGNMPEDAL